MANPLGNPTKEKATTVPTQALNPKSPDFQKLSIDATLTLLGADQAKGLRQDQIETIRKTSGFNEITEKKENSLLSFLKKFWGLSAWMLELIMVVSAILHKYADVAIVGALLIINAVVSFTQEHRAAGVVQALKKQLQVNTRVLRDGDWKVVPARELVPGDICRIRSGDIIPADVKLLDGTLKVDQSALTGESKDADKGKGDLVSSGSIVRTGEGNGVVVLIGTNTYFGRTTELVQEARPQLHIEAVISNIVKWLFAIVSGLLLVVVVLTLIRGGSILQIIPLMLVLLMGAVPIALPVMFTVAMATGSKELAHNGVLVTRLSAAEDAATMDVLCVDKTGTITQNKLAVSGVIPFEQTSENDVLSAGAIASQAANQDPIDLAFLAEAKEKGVFANQPSPNVISFSPFDAKNRRTEAIYELKGERIRAIKGAVDTIASASNLSETQIDALKSRVNESALKGYRTIAVAQGPETGKVSFLGLVELYDPLRPDAKALIAKLIELGIAVKMLTGDALAIAIEMGKAVGLPNIRKMSEITGGSASGDQAKELLKGVDGFAEVFPEDKYKVVKLLQSAKHVTGMTGDGVNDSPALRQAEVGIAVSTATDVAKGAASVVLTTPGLTNIVTLVEQGRTIYQRILTWIINKISHTLLTAGFVTVAYLFTGKFVVSAFELLLLVFVTDFAKISLATDVVRPSPKPETWKIGGFISLAIFIGSLMLVEGLLLLWFGWSRFGLSNNVAALHTFSFLILVYFAGFPVFSIRERRYFWSSMPSRVLLLSIIGAIVIGTIISLVGLAQLSALPMAVVSETMAYVVVVSMANDLLKVVFIKTRMSSSVN